MDANTHKSCLGGKRMIPYPVFGICGQSGSGKTTLIVELIQRLSANASARPPASLCEALRAGRLAVLRHSAPAFAKPASAGEGRSRRRGRRSSLSEGGSPWGEGGPARRSPPQAGEGGLKVGVIKHDAHGLNIDHEGKDSDRFFKAGADVLMNAPDQMFLRARPREEPTQARPGIDLEAALQRFAPHYDLVLLEGYKSVPAIDKVWLLKDEQEECPPEMANVRRVLRRGEDRAGIVMEMLIPWLTEKWLSTPVFAGVLIGGESLRMGRPKHLITTSDGRTWIEIIAASVQPLVKQTVILGKGKIPEALERLPALPDVEDIPSSASDKGPLATIGVINWGDVVQGPLAGILSAMRWRPDVSWLFLSCDMPRITTNALRWLLANRKPGVWAIMPRLTEGKGVEPLPGWYDFRALPLLETCRGPAGLAGHEKVATPLIPPEFAAAWTNVNTVSEL